MCQQRKGAKNKSEKSQSNVKRDKEINEGRDSVGLTIISYSDNSHN